MSSIRSANKKKEVVVQIYQKLFIKVVIIPPVNWHFYPGLFYDRKEQCCLLSNSFSQPNFSSGSTFKRKLPLGDVYMVQILTKNPLWTSMD